MNRIDLLSELVSKLSKLDVAPEYKYIGTGNPNADILIIGKETSISSNPQQKKMEIDENQNDWEMILSGSFPELVSRDNMFYTPFYPYKGQKLKIYRGKDNGGTSTTWYNYQKLINSIFKINVNPNIDFHENVFLTEVNSTPSLKTADADTSSIKFRKESVLSSPFFQTFPVVIISGLGYFEVNDNYNEIVELFGVEYQRCEFPDGKKSQEYFIHQSTDCQKILINTRQLGMNVSDNRINQIAEEIRNSKLITECQK